MNMEKMTYEMLTEHLKKQLPVLEHPEKLTQNVLAKIEHAGIFEKKIKTMKITALLSGMAASLLLCLLASEIHQSQHDNILPSHAVQTKENTIYAPSEIKISDIITSKIKKSNRKQKLYAFYSHKFNR
jgi:hypothetical protein